jgi:hypothetical protein
MSTPTAENCASIPTLRSNSSSKRTRSAAISARVIRTRDYLLPKLLSGEVEVKAAEKKIAETS